LPLDLENFLKVTVSVHFVIDGLMDSNYIWKKNIFNFDGRILYRWSYSCFIEISLLKKFLVSSLNFSLDAWHV
jgi:hypothetical protein